MKKELTQKIIENPKMLSHFMENSYYIKYLNRDAKNYKEFVKQMKILYKERTSDKIEEAIDGVEMVSSIIDTVK